MFPYSSEIQIDTHRSLSYEKVLEKVGPLLTEARRKKIQEVVTNRHFATAVVLEGLYDRGNISAVLRSGEGLGFAQFHVIETQEKFKESARVTKGADKWVEIQKWKSSATAIENLKSKGYRIVCTHLDSTAKPLHEVDFTVPTALIFGNEKEGVSAEMLSASDDRVIIPMGGFVESFNISVAAALCLYEIRQQFLRKKGKHGDLTKEQQGVLEALYYLRTQESGWSVLKNI